MGTSYSEELNLTTAFLSLRVLFKVALTTIVVLPDFPEVFENESQCGQSFSTQSAVDVKVNVNDPPVGEIFCNSSTEIDAPLPICSGYKFESSNWQEAQTNATAIGSQRPNTRLFIFKTIVYHKSNHLALPQEGVS